MSGTQGGQAHTVADVVIVGGGAVGSATAYFLAASPDFKGRIVVVERDPTYARASTPLSVGGIRQQFSIRENVEIGLYAREFVGKAADLLEVEGERPDLTFVENGYLFLAPPEGRDILAENHAVQTGAGATISWLETDELARRFPYINTDGVAAASGACRAYQSMNPSAYSSADCSVVRLTPPRHGRSLRAASSGLRW